MNVLQNELISAGGEGEYAALVEAEAQALFDAAALYLRPEDVDTIRRAFVFSRAAHCGQIRKSGEPYITHPIAVAKILTDWRIDSQGLCAALLHDVMEDTGVAKLTLAEHFGKSVADLVDGSKRRAQDTYVLVHGAWHTGAELEATATLLRQRGHTVHCPTLAGNRPGDDRASTGLEDAAQSLAAYLDAHDLQQARLARQGHESVDQALAMQHLQDVQDWAIRTGHTDVALQVGAA